LGGLPSDVAESPLAAAAFRLAEGLDDPKHSFTSRSMGAKAFQDILHELRELAPAPEMKDRLDELSSRRSRRRARGSAAG
jgi:hypothetical protein